MCIITITAGWPKLSVIYEFNRHSIHFSLPIKNIKTIIVIKKNLKKTI